MIWAYARDDVLPFSSWLKKVSPRTQVRWRLDIFLEVVHSFLIVAACQVPVNATLVAAAIPMCVMLTTLIRLGKLNVHEIVVDYCIAGGTAQPSPCRRARIANVGSPVYISFQAVVVAHLWASWTGRLDKHTLLTEQTTHHSDYFGLGKVRLRPHHPPIILGLSSR